PWLSDRDDVLVFPTCRLGTGPSRLVETRAPAPAAHALSLHDALPICVAVVGELAAARVPHPAEAARPLPQVGEHGAEPGDQAERDRKSTRLNSSHVKSSYAVFCLTKKTASLDRG